MCSLSHLGGFIVSLKMGLMSQFIVFPLKLTLDWDTGFCQQLYEVFCCSVVRVTWVFFQNRTKVAFMA